MEAKQGRKLLKKHYIALLQDAGLDVKKKESLGVEELVLVES